MNAPYACVIGDLSLVRALGRRGIPVAVATTEQASSLTRSRYCRTIIRTPSFVVDPEGAVEALVDWAAEQQQAPVVFYQGDHDLIALSRGRQRLGSNVRCVLPRSELVEDLADKLRFAALADRLHLPVPRTRTLLRGSALVDAARSWDSFPCVLKPAMRDAGWFGSRLHELDGAGMNQKAIRIGSAAELERLLPFLGGYGADFVLQAAVEGGEENIVSYHAYVRASGAVVAEFTGRKVRTAPRRYGLSTYVEITDDPEVKAIGRLLVERLDFSGVLKMDFKRDVRDRRLYLLEINPRFNLWHHPGTVAGVCLPELVYRDCVGGEEAAPPPVLRPGVRWISAREDRRAFREYRDAGELSLTRWLLQVATAEINEDFSLADPLPGIVELASIARRRVERARVRFAPGAKPTGAP